MFLRIALVASFAFAGTAWAAPIPVALIWQAPEGCPQYAEVWAGLSERLGRVPSTPDGTSFAARGLVVKGEAGWRVELQTLSASGAGTREFTSSTCEQLTQISVLALSVAIDPLLEPPPEVTPPSLWLGLGPETHIGVVPLPSAGLRVGASLELQRASFELFFETALPQRYERDGGRALKVSLPFGGGLSACLGFHGSRLSVEGCANLRGALVEGEGDGVARPRVGLAGYLGAGPGVQLRVLLHDRVALRARADGLVSIVLPSFAFADASVTYTSSLFSFAGSLAIEFRAW
jgi:hypothetical protein